MLHESFLKTVAAYGDGTEKVCQTIKEHKAFYDKELKAKRLQDRLLHVSYGVVREKVIKEMFPEDKLRNLLNSGLDPYSAVDVLWKGSSL